MKLFFTLFFLEIKSQFQQKAVLLFATLYILLVSLTYPLMIGISLGVLQKGIVVFVLYASILAQLLVVISVSDRASYDGALVHWYLSKFSCELFFLLRVVVSWLLFLIPCMCVIFLVTISYSLTLIQMGKLYLVVLCTLYLVSLFTHFSCMLLIVRGASGLLVTLILFPFLVPILVASGVFLNEGGIASVFLMVGYAISSTAAILIFAKIAVLRSVE
ncbi:MAG: heme exporter protein CcmB [Methylacidiphilales bacterium]|nr:heme exporter protein CcmB [Candidatus Methylacidiphilales bacterium]